MSEVNWMYKGAADVDASNPPIQLPNIIWKLLKSRGFNNEPEIDSLIKPSLKELGDPFRIDQMDKAVERLLKAKESNEKICLYADFDLDGTPGLALLKTGLEKLGFTNLVYFQPRRLQHGYGFHTDVAEKFIKEESVSLFVTVDVGITDLKTVEHINSLGAEVIITDHHLPKSELPKALAVVNPNKGTCNSKLGHLCGAGVAFFLVLAVRKKLKELNQLNEDFNPKELLDCFAIATITDLVPMIKENRVLVKHGLLQLAHSTRPGLRALLKELKLNATSLTSADVGIRFAPKLNALSRMDKELLPIDIFLCESEKEAASLVKEALNLNSLRLKLQKQAEEEAEEEINNKGLKSSIVICSRSFHKGVIGLVATKMANKYNRPSFIGAITENGDVHGSSRLPNNSNLSLLDALEFAKESLKQFGGHAPAAGFQLTEDNAELLEEKLVEYYEQNLESSSDKNIYYHVETDISDVDEDMMNWLTNLEPFGVEFESPILKVNSVELISKKVLKNVHYKYEFKAENGKISAIWFSPPTERKSAIDTLKQGDRVDFLAEPQWNVFNGRKSLQLLIKDMKIS